MAFNADFLVDRIFGTELARPVANDFQHRANLNEFVIAAVEMGALDQGRSAGHGMTGLRERS